MSDVTPRFALPLLAAGQAQKELFHNEALTTLEALAQPVAQTLGDDAPPSSPAPGQCWIVGAAPTGAWSGQPDTVALWSEGGWRFVAPGEGMALWVAAERLWARRLAGAWVLGALSANALTIGGVQVVGSRQPAIAVPSGGTAPDAEARAVLALVLQALRAHGLIGI